MLFILMFNFKIVNEVITHVDLIVYSNYICMSIMYVCVPLIAFNLIYKTFSNSLFSHRFLLQS